MRDVEKEERTDRSAEQELPVLEDFANRLLRAESSIELCLKTRQFSYDDHFSFLLIVHLRKQSENLKSIVKLLPSRDTTLIARSMLEGASQLAWITIAATQEGALLCRQFGAVECWREIKENDAN